MNFEASKSAVARSVVRVLAMAAVAVGLNARGVAAAERPRVLATTTVVADLVRQVGGDRVAVECLMAQGIDPHSYRATPRDADRLARADLVIASGLHLEGRLAEELARYDRLTVASVEAWLAANRPAGLTVVSLGKEPLEVPIEVPA